MSYLDALNDWCLTDGASSGAVAVVFAQVFELCVLLGQKPKRSWVVRGWTGILLRIPQMTGPWLPALGPYKPGGDLVIWDFGFRGVLASARDIPNAVFQEPQDPLDLRIYSSGEAAWAHLYQPEIDPKLWAHGRDAAPVFDAAKSSNGVLCGSIENALFEKHGVAPRGRYTRFKVILSPSYTWAAPDAPPH